MNTSIIFILPIWGEDKNRIRNFNIVLESWKKFSIFLKKNYINCEIYPISFFKEKIYKNVDNIDLSLLKYHRCFKLNYSVKKILDTGKKKQLLGIIDCDCFIQEKDYHLLLEEIRWIDFKNRFILLDMIDVDGSQNHNIKSIEKIQSNKISRGELNKNKRFFRHIADYPITGSMIVDFDIFCEIGGYDERFTLYGGDDDDIILRLINYGLDVHASLSKVIHFNHSRDLEHYDECIEKINKFTCIKKFKGKRLELEKKWEDQLRILYHDFSCKRKSIINDYLL